MRTPAALLLLALSARSVLSTCDGANSYTTLAGITGVVDENAAGTPVTSAANALAGCGIATGTNICVAETDFAKIQTYLDTLTTALETSAGTRDKYIIEQRGNVIKVLDSLRTLNSISASDIPTGYTDIASLFIGYAGDIADDFAAIVENFDTYQTARQTCMVTLIKTQAALLCASVLQTIPATITITSASVSVAPLDDALITEINTDCLDYIKHSATQSAIISTAVYSAGLSALASGLEKAVNGDNTGALEDLVTAFTEFGDATQSTDNAEKPVSIPTSCSATECDTWIEGTLFGTDGLLSQANAIAAGTLVTPTFTVSRALEGERRLAAGGFAPDLTDIGFTVAFEKNPGTVDNTENANSAMRNGIVACAIAALALF